MIPFVVNMMVSVKKIDEKGETSGESDSALNAQNGGSDGLDNPNYIPGNSITKFTPKSSPRLFFTPVKISLIPKKRNDIYREELL